MRMRKQSPCCAIYLMIDGQAKPRSNTKHGRHPTMLMNRAIAAFTNRFCESFSIGYSRISKYNGSARPFRVCFANISTCRPSLKSEKSIAATSSSVTSASAVSRRVNTETMRTLVASRQIFDFAVDHASGARRAFARILVISTPTSVSYPKVKSLVSFLGITGAIFASQNSCFCIKIDAQRAAARVNKDVGYINFRTNRCFFVMFQGFYGDRSAGTSGGRVIAFARNLCYSFHMHQWLKRHFIPHEGNNYQPHFLRLEITAAIFALVLVVEALYLAQVFIVFPKSDYLAAIFASVLIDQTNA